MTDLAAGRDALAAALRRELIGPAPAGPPVDLAAPFPTKADSYGPFVERGTGEEILAWTRPLKRYGTGVLFPIGLDPTDDPEAEDDAIPPTSDPDANELEDQALDDISEIADRSGARADDATELDRVNDRRPSVMAVSLLIDTAVAHSLELVAEGGRYDAVEVRIVEPDETRRVHVRRPWRLVGRPAIATLRDDDPNLVNADPENSFGTDTARFEVIARPLREDGTRLVTVVLANRATASGATSDTSALFQVGFRVRTSDAGGSEVAGILPYPGPPLARLDAEERSLALLHRRARTFAVGHGCSAEWMSEGDAARIATIEAVAMPQVEVPSITPDIADADGTPLHIPMATLAGLVPGDDGISSLDRLLEAYESWIGTLRVEVDAVEEGLRETAASHVAACSEALERMRRGLGLVRRDPKVRRAFELANRAVLSQQLRSEPTPRRVTEVSERDGVRFEREAAVIDERAVGAGRGLWRPFQIAFILASLGSTAEREDEDRDVVELIFFPTGGGKTEAYLGLAAFSMLLRRLRRAGDDGVDVLMRYTLRLLTAQQFLRASRLVCALEDLRRRFERELGPLPFTIGIWLGGETTPNTRKQAQSALRRLESSPATSDNPFLLDRCPWCSAELGPVAAGRTRPSKVVGYRATATSVLVHCPDARCTFHDGLPVHLVDEDIYLARPTMLIGTVDKFAMLAWRDDARALFGFGEDGERRWSPPNLIIQDELHLISGPLGSMVGLYEAVIERLCTDMSARGSGGLPKVVTSTATIRGFEDQVRALFARTRTSLFPPHGLHAEDSFFARYARDDSGALLPGRRYLGVHAGNHASFIETQVSVTSALLAAGTSIPEDERDPWWTQLVFFNTLRELGTSLSLLQSNVPMQMRAFRQHEDPDLPQRYINHVVELTSRLRNDEVPKALAVLERRYEDDRPVDVCLASNIIEVGIDVDRLSLMLVVGQPKTTSQYIQVTGRVGRRWWERPGLVVTLMNPSRPRDRSHYERFQSFHGRLYAQVEPTSVTPFSPAAVDRALHAALVAFVRQRIDLSTTAGPHDVPEHLLDEFERLMLGRAGIVDPAESEEVGRVLARRRSEWRTWSRVRWRKELDDADGLLVVLGQVGGVEDAHHWAAPMSMRNVDAECQLEVTLDYAREQQPTPAVADA